MCLSAAVPKFTTPATTLVLATALYVFSATITSSQAQVNIDAEAAKSLAANVQTYKRECDEPIKVAAEPASINPGVVARVVNLSGGACFGQPGKNAYLVAKGPSRWQRLLVAEPGFITVQGSAHAGYADLDMAILGMCVVNHKWNGKAYVRVRIARLRLIS